MNSELQPMLVDTTLRLLPPRIRRALLDDKLFTEQWEISTVNRISFDKMGLSFRRDQFYDAIRKAILKPGKAIYVRDRSNTVWNVLVQLQDETLAFSISTDGKCYSLTDHTALSEDSVIRKAWFEKTSREINFAGNAYFQWSTRISAALSDDEFSELMFDIELTPVRVYRNLQGSFEQRSVSLETLVPREIRYYERLIGDLGSATTVEEYIETVLKPINEGKQRWERIQGFLDSLLTCSIAQAADCIQIEIFSTEELNIAYQWLIERGDPISRVAAVEVALAHLDSYPGLEPYIEQIVEIIISEDPETGTNDYALLSATIVMIYSELARRHILGNNVAPFYRKQAALTQASLVIRAVNESGINPAELTHRMQELGIGHIFYLQGLVDLRLEPRWLPDFVSADQLRSEFIGRIVHSATRNEAKIQNKSLNVLLLGPDSKIANSSKWPFPYLPGPLEGAITSLEEIPEEILKKVKLALEADQLEANSFAGLVNSAFIFNLPEGQSSLAAEALRRAKFSIQNADDEDTAFGLINGLAIVAAVTRGTELANALRVLVRVLRRRNRLKVDLDQELGIVMIAAASFENLNDWARFAGEWVTETAFEIPANDAAKLFLSKLRRLVKIEPALARHCAAADAALDSLTH